MISHRDLKPENVILDDPPPIDHKTTIAIAVVTAAATTLATALVTWAVDELRARYGTNPPPPAPERSTL